MIYQYSPTFLEDINLSADEYFSKAEAAIVSAMPELSGCSFDYEDGNGVWADCGEYSFFICPFYISVVKTSEMGKKPFRRVVSHWFDSEKIKYAENLFSDGMESVDVSLSSLGKNHVSELDFSECIYSDCGFYEMGRAFANEIIKDNVMINVRLVNDYGFSIEEKIILKKAILDGAHTIGFYDADGVFFYIYRDLNPDMKYSYSSACGFDYAVARFDGVKDVVLF